MLGTKTKANRRAHRVWLIDMGDGSWAASCEACGLLCRTTRAVASTTAETHRPVVGR